MPGTVSTSNSAAQLRVAIIGAGPAGFYSALDILAARDLDTAVDMFDRLPAPYGLVRYGVAPDHQKIKSVVKVYERGVESAGTRFRMFGNVELGKDISLDELRARYHAVILTFGAQTDRRLGIPGEDLDRVYAAREFVAWYNSHPDFRGAEFDLQHQTAVVVGIGNVAIDVARMLAHTAGELATTDVAEAASDALIHSDVREIVILARRGPLQASCTPVELRELARLEGADLVVAESDLVLDPLSAAALERGDVPTQNQKNYKIICEEALHEPRAGRKVIRMRFYVSPTEILGATGVDGVVLGRNTLREGAGGRLSVQPLDETETLDCGIVFRSIGYRVQPLPDVPYDEEWGVIPHDRGQVLASRAGDSVPGLFVAGWAKRGPSGVIGTNKPDASETVGMLLAAHNSGALAMPTADSVEGLLAERGVEYVGYDDWKLLDALEIEAGEDSGRPRVKFDTVEAMLEALAASEQS
jgi:ferredoxin/flavodoxin---NADP+ reductase